MALINCKECNKEISSQAASCPHCGVKLKSSNWLIYTVLIIVFIVWTLGTNYENAILKNPIATKSEEISNLCDESMIKILEMNTKFKNFCSSSDCIALTGTIVLENTCNEPVGVQLKVIAYDKDNKPIQVKELWPASTRNIRTGKESFSTDHWIKYDPDIASVTAQPIKVNVWRTRD